MLEDLQKLNSEIVFINSVLNREQLGWCSVFKSALELGSIFHLVSFNGKHSDVA